MKILIVDDDAEIRASFKFNLLSYFPNAEVDEATDMQEALTITAAKKFGADDLITMDGILAHGTTGPETVRELRRGGCKSKIVMVPTRQADIMVGLAAGADRGIPKDHFALRIEDILRQLGFPVRL